MSAQRDQFQIRVDTLAKQVRAWVEPHEWVTKTYPKKMRDVDHQIYEVPALYLQKGPVRVLLDPVAYDVPGAEGVVYLYLMPTYDDLVSFYFEEGKWNIHCAFPPDPNATHSVIDGQVLPLSETTRSPRMPNLRFNWHEHINDVEGEYRAARIAVDRLKAQVVATPEILRRENGIRVYLRDEDKNLEGTYLVRLFAAFEAALRSYDRARHNDRTRDVVASVLIDTISGRKGQGISAVVREGAHAVRRVRNFWAHENDALPAPMSMAQARGRLQTYVAWLPEEWG